MGTAPRRGRPGHDLETVLAASVEVFNERGFDGTSIDDLAKRLRITKSAIYHHIQSKDALLGLALDRALTGLEQVAAEVALLDGAAVQRLEALVRSSVRMLVEQLPYVTLLLRVRGNSDVERRALARRRRLDNLAAALVAQAIEEGDLRGDLDPALTARLIFGTVNSLTEWLKPSRGQDAAALSEAVGTAIFRGLRT
ncbi:TetR/AcrR family transcriptional regulator [Jatrophihabitans sp. GAS493]|uniref:TetR/AcrR family transcriptional regulator n=1 Tax=Jatrophihabitans sp. GAS493 TaxID=1907575 RepID=UPI000BB6A199